MKMFINILQDLPTYSDAVKITPYNAAGYGALVAVLGYLAWKFWNANQRLYDEHKIELKEAGGAHKKEIAALVDVQRIEVDALRKENREDVDRMLEINAQSIPILTKVITMLGSHEEHSKDVKDDLSKLIRGHEQFALDHMEIKKKLKE